MMLCVGRRCTKMLEATIFHKHLLGSDWKICNYSSSFPLWYKYFILNQLFLRCSPFLSNVKNPKYPNMFQILWNCSLLHVCNACVNVLHNLYQALIFLSRIMSTCKSAFKKSFNGLYKRGQKFQWTEIKSAQQIFPWNNNFVLINYSPR